MSCNTVKSMIIQGPFRASLAGLHVLLRFYDSLCGWVIFGTKAQSSLRGGYSLALKVSAHMLAKHFGVLHVSSKSGLPEPPKHRTDQR